MYKVDTERRLHLLFSYNESTAAEHIYMNESVHSSHDHSPGMASAAMILGLISVIMIATGLSVVIGSVGVIIALMSRTSGPLPAKAKAGLFTSLIGLIGGIVTIVIAFCSLYTGDLDQTLKRINYIYEKYTNEGTIDLDDPFSDDSSSGNNLEKTALIVSWNDGEVMKI